MNRGEPLAPEPLMATPADELAWLSARLRALQTDLEVVRPLGAGTTSHVFLARETALQRLVALKVLRPELAADAVARQRFEREAQSAARITHPNVTAIHRVGWLTADVPYIVMEYIDGRTLRDVIASGGALDASAGRALLAAVASALAAAHDRGIIHRDVCPGNIYLENRTGRAVLGDFGIAALLASGSASAVRLTGAGVRLGQTPYMSPEQIRGEPATEQSDVYSFGVLAYEVLAGRGPYDAATDAQLLAAHLQLEPLRLRELRPGIDATLAGLIERCLAKDPNRRPRAQELAAALAATGVSALDAARPPDRGPLAQLLAELRHRRVYRVVVGYGAFAITVLGVAEVVYDAFELSRFSYRVLVTATLAGFPLAIVLAWLYDIRADGVRRTRPTSASGRTRALMWGGLAACVIAAAVLGWLLLRGD